MGVVFLCVLCSGLPRVVPISGRQKSAHTESTLSTQVHYTVCLKTMQAKYNGMRDVECVINIDNNGLKDTPFHFKMRHQTFKSDNCLQSNV